jgi:inactivated superfamily I helicase
VVAGKTLRSRIETREHNFDCVPNDTTGITHVLNESAGAAAVMALVERNLVHMDDADTVAILAALEELGVVAESTEQTMLLKTAWWVLTLHWLGDDLPHLGFDSLLTLLGQRVWKHYRERKLEGPARIDVYDSDDEIIASHETNDDGDDDSREAVQ